MESLIAWGAAAAALAALAWRELSHRRTVRGMRQMVADSRANATRSEELASVGALVSGLAQELKTPLQGVLGNTELMLMSTDRGETGTEELREIRDNATLAAGIVRNLLAFADTTALKRNWHDLNSIVARAIETCRMEQDAANVRIDVTPTPRLPLAYVDGRQLEKVLTTFIGRAGHAGRSGNEGPAVVIVTAHRRTQPDDRLLIEIDDDAAVSSPLDDAFGIGGLTSCTKIVEAHGGGVLVAPRSRGLHVQLELPVTADLAAPGHATHHRHEETSATWTT